MYMCVCVFFIYYIYTYICVYVLHIYVLHTHIYTYAIQPLKRSKSEVCDDVDEPWEYCTKWNKPVTEKRILHDSTYLRYLK